MRSFEDREKGFEAEFKRNQELQFRVTARGNRLFGLWAAGRLGIAAGDEAEAYARTVVDADFEKPGDSDVIEKVQKDLAAQGDRDVRGAAACRVDARRPRSEAPAQPGVISGRLLALVFRPRRPFDGFCPLTTIGSTPDGVAGRPADLGKSRDADRARDRARDRQSRVHRDPGRPAAGEPAGFGAAARPGAGGADPARAARVDRLDHRFDNAGIRAVRSWVFLARHHPDRRRAVSALQGHARDPRTARGRGRARRRHPGRGELRRRHRADHGARHRVLARQRDHRGRDGERVVGDGGGGDHRRADHDRRLGTARRLCRQAPDDQDAGAELPAADRHDSGRRRDRVSCAEGVHLRRDRVLGHGRGAEPGRGAAATPAPRRDRHGRV